MLGNIFYTRKLVRHKNEIPFKKNPQKKRIRSWVKLCQSMLGSTLFKDGRVKFEKRSEQDNWGFLCKVDDFCLEEHHFGFIWMEFFQFWQQILNELKKRSFLSTHIDMFEQIWTNLPVVSCGRSTSQLVRLG